MAEPKKSISIGDQEPRATTRMTIALTREAKRRKLSVPELLRRAGITRWSFVGAVTDGRPYRMDRDIAERLCLWAGFDPWFLCMLVHLDRCDGGYIHAAQFELSSPETFAGNPRADS